MIAGFVIMIEHSINITLNYLSIKQNTWLDNYLGNFCFWCSFTKEVILACLSLSPTLSIFIVFILQILSGAHVKLKSGFFFFSSFLMVTHMEVSRFFSGYWFIFMCAFEPAIRNNPQIKDRICSAQLLFEPQHKIKASWGRSHYN